MSFLKTAPVADGAGEPVATPVKMNRDHDRGVKLVLTAVALVSVAVIFFIIVFTLSNSWTAISDVGLLEFIFGTKWSPSQDQYGALALILGTVLVTIGAMVIAVPLGIAAAIFLTQVASERIRNILKPICEIFAGIPSVIYGMFGMIFIVPLIVDLFPDQASGACWLAASIVLGIMALPTIISVSDDAIRAVPHSYLEASLAMGATRWETVRKVIIPAAISGISAAVILGIGRALGETMAVIMVAGNAAVIPEPFYNIFSLIRTITASIALEMPDLEYGGLHYSALFLLALILMVIVVAVNLFARYIINSNKRRMGIESGKKKLISIPKIIPENVSSAFQVRKPLMFKIFIIAIVFVFLWMMGSLFTSYLESFAVAAVVAVAIYVAMYYSGKRTNPNVSQKFAFGVMTIAMIIILAILAILIGDIVIKGVPALSWDFITSPPSNMGREGGIGPAILGTIELIVGTAIIALPLGIIAGIWLSQYSGNGKVTGIVRNAVDALNGTPSIVFGLFGLAAFVTMAGWGYCLLAGCLTLAFMILPVIIRTTEEAVSAVPHDLLEASMAMGASKWQSIYKVILPAAMGGVMTGSILGLGRAAGETAPIMFTAVTIFSFSTELRGLFEPVMALPYHLYYLALEVPNSDASQYGTALILLIIVLVMFGLASLVRYKYSKNMKW